MPKNSRIADSIPGDQEAFWTWCLEADRDRLLDVLAVAAAHGIDAVESKREPNHAGRAQGDLLAAALRLNMADWYRPTAVGYFNRLGKADIIAILRRPSSRRAFPRGSR